MKGRDDLYDPEFDAVWHAFAADDARVKAPGRVGQAVMAAWDAAPAQRVGRRPRRSRFAPAVVLLAAAALVLATGLAVRYDGRGSGEESRDEGRSAPGVTGPVAVSAVPTRPSAITSATGAVVLRDRLSQPVVPTVTRDRAATSSITGAGPIVTLTADEVFETEVLQIMRVRMPLEALQAFGVPLPESEAWRVVDVDVLVGADGLAREIRQIRSVVDNDAQGFGR